MQYHHYAELSAFVAGILLVKRDWPFIYKMLVALTALTFLVEISGYLIWTKLKQNNNWLYNLYLPVQCFCILYFFYKVSEYKLVQKINLALIITMFAGTIISYFIHRSFFFLNSYASELYLILMLVAAGLFYIDSIVNDVEIRLVKQPPFWLSTGLLFFCIIYILIFAFWNLIKQVPYYRVILFYSNIVANTFLYGGIIICFLCMRKTRNYYTHS